MTIESLLDMSAAELAALTDDELRTFFKQFETVVRPEFLPPPKMPAYKQQAVASTKQFKAKVEQLKDLGLDLSFLQHQPKRKK